MCAHVARMAHSSRKSSGSSRRGHIHVVDMFAGDRVLPYTVFPLPFVYRFRILSLPFSFPFPNLFLKLFLRFLHPFLAIFFTLLLLFRCPLLIISSPCPFPFHFLLFDGTVAWVAWCDRDGIFFCVFFCFFVFSFFCFCFFSEWRVSLLTPNTVGI